MRRPGLAVGVLLSALLVPAVVQGEGAAPLEVQKTRVRWHRNREAGRDRVLLRGSFPLPSSGFQPRWERLDFRIDGTEVLCIPGYIPFLKPLKPERRWTWDPDPGNPDPDRPRWVLTLRGEDRWIYTTRGRRVVLDLEEGTILVRGRNLDLSDPPATDPADVDLSLVLDDDPYEATVPMEGRGSNWVFRGE